MCLSRIKKENTYEKATINPYYASNYDNTCN